MSNLNQSYWENRYRAGETGWDIGYASPPIRHWAEAQTNHRQRILVPGAGNAYEVQYLHEQGFTHTHLLDIAPSAVAAFRQRYPQLPPSQIHVEDFFAHQGQYDTIVEQTFFCALPPAQRAAYCQHCHRLLAAGGRIVGLLWAQPMNTDSPPYGGDEAEYRALFEPMFEIRTMRLAADSIKPRLGRELWVELEKKPLG